MERFPKLSEMLKSFKERPRVRRQQFNPTSSQQGLRIKVLECCLGLDQQPRFPGSEDNIAKFT